MEDVSLFQAMVITILSMAVVFIVLVLISYLIGVLKNLGQKEKRESMEEIIEPVKDLNINEDEELVAVIAAVIAANMGVRVPDIKVKKIRRIHNSVWNNAARLERLN